MDFLPHALLVAFPVLIPICHGEPGEPLRTEPNQKSLRALAFLACAMGSRAASNAITSATDARLECEALLKSWKTGSTDHLDMDGFEDAVARHTM